MCIWSRRHAVALDGSSWNLHRRFAFLEVFQDIFHPTWSGSLSDYAGRSIFRQLRRWPSVLSLAGPLTVVVTILSWALLQGIGFALIYWAAYPDGFSFSPSDQSGSARGFWAVLYYSFEVLTTLGLGDVLPRTNLLRILSTFQALIGFAPLTASVSSILLIFPALSRMRVLARRTKLLIEASREIGTGLNESVLNSFTRELIEVRADFIHFPVIYYFHSDHRRSSLAHSLPDLLRLAERASHLDSMPEMRLSGVALRIALEDFARILAPKYLDVDSRDLRAVLNAYCIDHPLPHQTS